MNYDTFATQYAGRSEHNESDIRRIVEVAALRRVYGRIAEWENEKRVLRNQVVPMIIWISFWLTLNWAAGWNFGDATPAHAPAPTQTATQVQPVTLGCR